MQHYVSLVEKILQSFALLARSTSVTITGDKFAGFFKEKPALAPKVWAVLVNPPKGLARDMIVAPSCREVPFDSSARLTFYLNERAVSIERDLKQLLTTGMVSLHEMPAEDFLADPAHSAHWVAERVVHHSIYMCAVLLVPYHDQRERAIRTAIKAQLVANGSTDSETQANAVPIIAASSLSLLEDTQRNHLIVDAAHRLGTEEHGQWVSWAVPMHARGILQSVDLVAAADLASACPGFSIVHELSTLSRFADEPVRQLARRLLETRLSAERELHFANHKVTDAVNMVRSSGGNGAARPLFVVSRLAQGTERRENETFLKAVPSGTFRHCALLGHDEFALVMAHHVNVLHAKPVVLLRDTVASKFNLRDWITFLAALPSKEVIVLCFSPKQAGDKMREFIDRARLPKRPELTTTLV